MVEQEVANSSWCKYLRGIVCAPNVPFTCTNMSAQGGSLIDFCMHSRQLQPYVKVEPITTYSFKPHVVSLRVTIAKEIAPEEALVMDLPTEISESYGPRNFYDSWQHHWAKAANVD